ncbi:hypothetical protein CC2G_015285 [Coprinopsis cinerea AmutBmut pab1-1]|nr:hypothetical protein CC2G_015285 [Coprinopsis cinerea AmutBmut pab1-1]
MHFRPHPAEKTYEPPTPTRLHKARFFLVKRPRLVPMFQVQLACLIPRAALHTNKMYFDLFLQCYVQISTPSLFAYFIHGHRCRFSRTDFVALDRREWSSLESSDLALELYQPSFWKLQVHYPLANHVRPTCAEFHGLCQPNGNSIRNPLTQGLQPHV